MSDTEETPAPEVAASEAAAPAPAPAAPAPAPAPAAARPAAPIPMEPRQPAPDMFHDAEGYLREFPSTWRKAAEMVVGEMQTEPVSTEEEECQTIQSIFSTKETEERAAQTDPMGPGVPKSVIDGETNLWPGVLPEGDEDDLLAFLETAGPYMEEQLDWNLHTHAFNNYSVNWEESHSTMDLLHTLSAPKATEIGLQCVQLSWNCTGAVIAAAYGKIDTVGWCPFKGYLCAWNINSRKMVAEKPDITVEVENYVMAIDFHPSEPTQIAGGTYNGEIMIWDLSNGDEPVIAQSRNGSMNHVDPVKQVKWVRNTSSIESRYVLLSASGDGKILIWSTQNGLAQPVSAYEPLDRKNHTVGITCLAVLFSNLTTSGLVSTSNSIETSNLENPVIAGSEAGTVHKTIIKPIEKIPEVAKSDKGDVKEIKLTATNPINLSYEPHTGPVQAISASPFHRNLFLTCSSDGYIHIHNALESQIIMSLSPAHSTEAYLYCAEFSPSRPMVFACGSRDSYMYLYDLEQSHVKATAAIKAGEGNSPILSMKFNQVQPSILASGDYGGNIKVWSMEDHMVRPSQHETTLLRAKEASVITELWMRIGGITI